MVFATPNKVDVKTVESFAVLKMREASLVAERSERERFISPCIMQRSRVKLIGDGNDVRLAK